MGIVKPSQVVFVNEKIEKEFVELEDNDEIKIYIKRAIEDIKKNAFCGIPIPKRLIPREYIKRYNVTNLWKYNLPNGWRLIYFIATPNKIEILSIILEWFNHPGYERRFNY